MEEIYLGLLHQVKDKQNIHIVRSKSELFLKSCDDNYFDAIYIDGDHTANAVYIDLVNSFNKIKPNGLIMGHDYHYNVGGDVLYAVNKFCATYNQSVTSIAEDGCPSFVIKAQK